MIRAMIRLVGLVAILVTLLAVPVWAAPNATMSASAPVQYQDGTMIPITDPLTYTVYCGSTSGSHPFVFAVPNLDVGTTVDVSACVQGTIGTYYFVATATSTEFSSESVTSAEISRLYTANDLGKVPLPPTLFTIQ